MFISLNFMCVIEIKDENYATGHYISLYSIKNRAELYNLIQSTYQIKGKIS